MGVWTLALAALLSVVEHPQQSIGPESRLIHTQDDAAPQSPQTKDNASRTFNAGAEKNASLLQVMSHMPPPSPAPARASFRTARVRTAAALHHPP